MGAERSIVARRIEEIRLGKKWSRQQLADRMNVLRPRQKVTRLQVWRIETGVTEISVDAAAAFADALDVSVVSLYRESRAAS